MSNKTRAQLAQSRIALGTLCLLVIVIGLLAFVLTNDREDAPQPGLVQVVNPMVTVSGLEEMETMLDFSVPVLDKAVDKYIVLVMDSRPTMGRVYYADGAVFSIRYGTGDVSGIYGGTEQARESVNGVTVTYWAYENTRYALWETDGFTHSLTGGEELKNEVAALLG